MKQEPSTESIILGQKMVMISASYVTIFFYAIILWQLILLQESFTRINELIIGFGVGALISIFISTLIIRKALENQKKFSYTLISLAIAHIPVLIGLIYAFLLLNESL